jgi:hypothetical protein|tara:strand:- start:2473 stop:3384 length:912 start_codon:yes stop_codon:yes gene_type:complete
MDILTLGKMNAMARNTDVALELMANHLYESQQEICNFQAGNMNTINNAVASGIAAIAAGAERGSGPTHSLYIGCATFDGHTGGEGQNYGGWSCSWVVPADVKSIKFDIYGAGASGYGGCCCMMNPLPGGAGGYAVKHLNLEDGHFVAGDTYAICAGGTGCCWPHQHGVRGHTSYITGPGLSNFCAVGGHTSINNCASFNCYTCCHTCFGCAPIYGADYGVAGTSSWRMSSQYCASSMFQVASHSGGPLSHGGSSFSPDACTFGYHSGGSPSSPGNGAYGAAVSWPCCCGKSGGGGGVLVTYWG